MGLVSSAPSTIANHTGRWLTSLSARRFLIAAISVFDAWLVVQYSESIVMFEQNPVGLFLIRIMNGVVSLFVLTKLAGTSVVFYVLREIEVRDIRAATLITNGLLAFQTWLIWYLVFSNVWTTNVEKFGVALLTTVVFIGPIAMRSVYRWFALQSVRKAGHAG